MTARRRSNSEAETLRLARRLAAALRPGDVVALEGVLGAGKTCFVRGLAEGLGIDPAEVASPTFVLCRLYGPGTVGLRLAHVDAFRLAGEDELESIGWDELVAETDSVVAIEWADRVGAALPQDRIVVAIEHAGGDARVLELSARDDVEARWAGAAGDEAQQPCPICGRPVSADGPSYPFCSQRCRLVDLGHWMGERYRV